MTGNVVIDLGISVVAVAILVGLARLIFGKSEGGLDVDRATARLKFDEPDFRPRDWLINDERTAALARGEGGDIAVVFSKGEDMATRRLGAGEGHADYRDGRLIVERADHTARPASFVIDPEAAKLWLGAIAGAEPDPGA